MPGSDAVLQPSQKALKGLRNTAIICALVFLVGLFTDPQRAWGGYLMGFQFFTGLALAGAVFTSIFYLANAKWGTALRRIPEAMIGALPVAACLGLVLLAGVPSLYEDWAASSLVEVTPLVAHKAGWLNVPFFCLRMVIYFALWIWSAGRLVRASRAQDMDGDRVHTSRNLKSSALFMAIFAITFSLASVDWIQSLEPEWFSTMFALITSTGVVCSGIATVIIVAVLLRRTRAFRHIVTRSHLDDLGKIAMGFSLLWVYIWFCQYMLIWYTNMPEETTYFIARQQGSWGILTPANLVLNFLIPFLVLMPKRFRRSGPVLLRVAITMLVGHALNLYLLVEPSLLEAGPELGLWEVAPVVGCLALFAHVLLRKLAEAPLVPKRDPWLEESLSYHC